MNYIRGRMYIGNANTRARIDRICRRCELEISRILLTVDLCVMDMSEFEVILRMDLLTAHRVVIDCDRMRVTAYTPDGTCVVFKVNRHDASPHTMSRLDSRSDPIGGSELSSGREIIY